MFKKLISDIYNYFQKEDPIVEGRIPQPKPGKWDEKPINVPTTYPEYQTDLEFEIKKICDDNYEYELVNTKKYPYCLICELQMDFGHMEDKLSATGFFISEKCIITAAHTIFKAGYYAKSVTVFPGANGKEQPFGSATTNELRVPKKYEEGYDDKYDYGVIFLKTNDLYNELGGYFGFKNINNNDSVAISGYKNDKKSIQRETKGKVSGSQTILKYRIDTVDGVSGGPLLQYLNDQFYVVGIHIGGACPNKAVHIKNKVYNDLQSWKIESQ